MKRSLMRPTDVLFPLASIAASKLGNVYSPFYVLICYYILQLFSLCAVDCFRNAASREPGVRRVDKRFGGAILPILFAIGVSILLFLKFAEESSELIYIMPTFGAAVCLIFEQLFEERMHAIGKSVDVVMMSVVSSVLFFGGMMLDSCWKLESPLDSIFTLCGAGMGMVISMIASLISEPLKSFSLVPRNLGFIPKALVQTLLYPAAMCVILFMQVRRGDDYIHALEKYLALPLLYGLIPWRLSRTVCRRTQDESRTLNLLLIGFAALGIIYHAPFEMMGFYFKGVEIYQIAMHICSEALIVALICGAIVFCAPSVRFYVGTILIVVAGNMCRWDPPYGGYIIIALCLIAVVLNLKKAFLKKI